MAKTRNRSRRIRNTKKRRRTKKTHNTAGTRRSKSQKLHEIKSLERQENSLKHIDKTLALFKSEGLPVVETIKQKKVIVEKLLKTHIGATPPNARRVNELLAILDEINNELGSKDSSRPRAASRPRSSSPRSKSSSRTRRSSPRSKSSSRTRRSSPRSKSSSRTRRSSPRSRTGPAPEPGPVGPRSKLPTGFLHPDTDPTKIFEKIEKGEVSLSEETWYYNLPEFRIYSHITPMKKRWHEITKGIKSGMRPVFQAQVQEYYNSIQSRSRRR